MKKKFVLLLCLMTFFTSAHAFEARFDVDVAVPLELGIFDRAGIYIGGSVGTDLFFNDYLGITFNGTVFTSILSVGWGATIGDSYAYQCGFTPEANASTLDAQGFLGLAWKAEEKEKTEFIMAAGVDITLLSVKGASGISSTVDISAINFGLGLEQKYLYRITKHVGLNFSAYESLGLYQSGDISGTPINKFPLSVRAVPKIGVLFIL